MSTDSWVYYLVPQIHYSTYVELVIYEAHARGIMQTELTWQSVSYMVAKKASKSSVSKSQHVAGGSSIVTRMDCSVGIDKRAARPTAFVSISKNSTSNESSRNCSSVYFFDTSVRHNDVVRRNCVSDRGLKVAIS